jgi:hypothetical protein
MVTIEIKDSDSNGCLAAELIDILRALPAEARQLSWTILDLEAVGDLGTGKNMLDLEREVRESPSGLHVDWDELLRLASSFFQVINATIVGIKPVSQFPHLANRHEINKLSEVVIEMIDSSLWAISSKSDKFIQSIQTSFHDTEVTTNDLS